MAGSFFGSSGENRSRAGTTCTSTPLQGPSTSGPRGNRQLLAIGLAIAALSLLGCPTYAEQAKAAPSIDPPKPEMPRAPRPAPNSGRVGQEAPGESPLPEAAPGGGPCSGTYPLPLASHWTPHSWQSHSTTPRWQLDRIREGHKWLLTFWWGDFEPWSPQARSYYHEAISEARRRKLPISIVSRQWEGILNDKSPWKDLPVARSPLAFDLQGRSLGKLSPLGALEPWVDAGKIWATTPILKALQELYPDPPFVVLLSNNEARRIKQGEISRTLRFRRLHPRGVTSEERRRIMGSGFLERQSAMVESLRSHLNSWKERSLIVGWGGGNANFGRRRWLGQSNPDFGMTIPGRLNTAPFVWDGIAAKYYVDSTVRRTSDDFTLFSPKVQIMNLNLELSYACSINPKYYWELTTWFNDAFVKELREREEAELGARFGGFVRFGMWTTRPRVVRHFSRRREGLPLIDVFLHEVIQSVDEVHENPILSSFWESGTLVSNQTREHPYHHDIPEEHRGFPRWTALNTDLDPPTPWHVDDVLPVWALALRRDLPEGTSWLLFAQSPLGSRDSVAIEIPKVPKKIHVSATQRGCFFHVREGGKRIDPIAVNGEKCQTGMRDPDSAPESGSFE